MSKTDKTAPWRVKVHYAHEYLEEHHDHSKGDCDLPPRPKVGEDFSWPRFHGQVNCYWDFSFAYYRSPWARCGCDMCGYDAFQTPRRKRQRKEGKRIARNWRDEW